MSETTDLRPWGWAPGGYSIRCRDCSPNAQVPGASGDKRCWRCEPCARKAMEREPVTTCDACPACHTRHLPGAPCHQWPNTVPSYPTLAPTRAGCICPIGANLQCENPTCPRKPRPPLTAMGSIK
jgi:hypothetical protein